jgi:hypothetical protein
MKSILSRFSSFSILLLALGAGPCSAQTPVTIPITGNLGQLAGTPQPNAYVTLLLENCSGGLPQITGYTNIVPTSAQFVADTNGQINGTVWANDQITCGGTTGATIYALSLYDPNNNQIGQTQCFQVVHTQGAWNINTQSTVACGTTPPNPTNGTYGNLNSTGFFQGNNGAFSGALTVGGTVIGHSTLDLPIAGGTMTGPLISPVTNSVQYPTSFATLQSDVTACASATCTLVVNSTMATTSNYSIPSTVTVQVNNGAQLQPSTGTTLTINGAIQAPPVQIFGGAGTIVLGALVATAPVQWWGAVADSNTTGSTGTDNTAAIQSCLNAIYSGQCFLSAGNYKITSALSIGRNEVGLRGVDNGWVTSPIAPPTNPSRIVLRSATGDILDVAGTDAGHNIVANRIEYITLTRGLTPSTSGVNANLALKYSYGAIIRSVTVEDAQYGFYFIGVGAGLNGYVENCAAYWGYNGFVETAGNLFGYYIESSTGVNSPSLRIRNSGAGSGIPMANVGVTTYGMASQGTQPHDLHVTHFETALLNTGIFINDTAPGGSSAADIYLDNSINDGCYSTCVLVIGASSGTVNITNGWEAMELGTPSLPVIDIRTSSHVTVADEHLFCPACTAPLLSMNGGGSNIVTGVDFLAGANGAIVC